MARAPRSNPGGATNDGQPGEASISLRGTEAGSAGKTISAGKRAALTALPAAAIGAIALLANVAQAPSAPGNQPTAPAPLVAGQQVEWWAAFKFNAGSFATSAEGSDRNCPFGGAPQSYSAFSQQYAVATSQNPQLQDGDGLIGTGSDPVGSTFGQIYRGSYHYVVWNDQLYDAPKITGCSKECGSPWGHSKGLLAWDDSGEGLVGGTSRFVIRTALSWTDREQTESRLTGGLPATRTDPSRTLVRRSWDAKRRLVQARVGSWPRLG